MSDSAAAPFPADAFADVLAANAVHAAGRAPSAASGMAGRGLAVLTCVDARIDPHRDHRVAMSLAVLGMRTGGIRIDDPGCVSKSYPQFWTALDLLSRGRAGAGRRAIE